MQVIVDSSLGITVDNILDLPEVGFFSIIRKDEMSITRMGDVDRWDSGELGVGGITRWIQRRSGKTCDGLVMPESNENLARANLFRRANHSGRRCQVMT